MPLLIVLFYQLMLQYESEPIICVYYQRLLEPHIQLPDTLLVNINALESLSVRLI